MLQKLLEEIGLAENEAKLYLVLLQYGQRPISFLSQRAGLNRGLGYVVLHALLEKGLVSKTTKGRVQYFAPLDPKRLVDYLDHQKVRIEGQQERVHAALGRFAAIVNPLASKPKIRFFDGPEGARNLLQEARGVQETMVRAFVSFKETTEFVGIEHFRGYICGLLHDAHTVRTIQSSKSAEEDRAAGRKGNSIQVKGLDTDRYQTRITAEALHFPMTVLIFDEKIALLSSARENFALLIESREYSEMQKKLFDLLWTSTERTTIRIGLLHSLTGTMAISESSLLDAELLAIEELNTAGGILGRRIDPVVLDGASDPEIFARRAEQLITEHGVSSVFGGWTSACRKTMKPIFEQHDHLLWYPVQYEGLEQSPNIIYVGAAPNQQILPSVDWAVKKLGKKFFLVGSDYVFPRSAHEIIKARLEELNATVVGEAYEKLGSRNFKAIVNRIKAARPDVILNSINGDSNVDFFRELRAAGISPKKIPTLSFSIGEDEISRLGAETLTGDYAVWSYFESLDSPKNIQFVKNFQQKYGRHRRTDDAIEAAYCSIHLFAKAVNKAGTDSVSAVREAARGLQMDAPEGKIRVDPDNLHLHRMTRIGRLDSHGQFNVVWTSDTPLKPDPYPKYKSKQEWQDFLEQLHTGWGNRWGKD